MWGAMAIELKDRVAIVTGGGSGIGRETALTFARAGANVVVWDVVDENGRDTVAEVEGLGRKAIYTKVNVADQAVVSAAVGEALDSFGRIDILINNAGIVRDARLIRFKDGELVGRMSEAEFDAVISVNLKGVFNCTVSVAPVMVRQNYGRIVSTASVVGLYGNFGQTNYVASKAGVIGMTRVWARELARNGITVNAVAPGFIGTEMTRGMPEKVLEEMVRRTPVGRIGSPRDIANAFLFLSSEEAGFVNGTVLSVDGGLVLGT